MSGAAFHPSLAAGQCRRGGRSDPAGRKAAGVAARERIPRGHKMAVAAIAEDEPVRKFGQIIGFAVEADRAGRHGSTSTTSRLHDFARDYHFAEGARNDEILPPELRATFQGYVRPNGKIGTRNYVGESHLGELLGSGRPKFIAEAFNRSGVLDDYPEIDGVVAFVHGTGCGMAAYGEGFDVAAAHAMGLRHASQSRRRADGRARLRGVPDRPHEGRIWPGRGRHFQTMTIQATGGTKKTDRRGRRAHQGDAADRRQGAARDAAGER